MQWKSEISKKRQAFTDQSVKVKEWDNALVRNNEQIMKLQKEVNNVKVHQHRYVGSPDPRRPCSCAAPSDRCSPCPALS